MKKKKILALATDNNVDQNNTCKLTDYGQNLFTETRGTQELKTIPYSLSYLDQNL